jgi:hypothetical protein
MKKDKRIVIRVSEDELGLFNECSGLVGVGLSAWGRSGLKGYAKATMEAFGNIPVEKFENPLKGEKISKNMGDAVTTVSGLVIDYKLNKPKLPSLKVTEKDLVDFGAMVEGDQKREKPKKEVSVPEKKSGGLTKEKLDEIERQVLAKAEGAEVSGYPYAPEEYEAIAKKCGPGPSAEEGRFDKSGATVYFGFKGATYAGSLGEGIRVFLAEHNEAWYAITANWVLKAGAITSIKK